MEGHCEFVWNDYVKDSGFEDIAVVAHSAGGSCLENIQKKFAATFYS
jgi:hypothetical protein